MVGLTLAVISVAAPGLLVVRQWDEWVRVDQRLTKDLSKSTIRWVQRKCRFLSSGYSCFFLAGSTWGTNTLWSSALALCYSAAECCTPVWSRSAHTSQVDTQLNCTMRLISGTLRSTPLRWLPVLSNIEPPALRRKAATDKLVEKIVKCDGWPI